MIRRRRNADSSGVALLEVLLAATIVGLGLGASMQAMSSITSSQSRIEERQLARRLAEQILVDLRTGAAQRSEPESSGNFEAPNSAFRWRVIRDNASGEDAFNFVTIRIERRETERTVHRLVSLVPAAS